MVPVSRRPDCVFPAESVGGRSVSRSDFTKLGEAALSCFFLFSHNRPVQCAPSELFYFNPPGGQTCVSLLSFIRNSSDAHDLHSCAAYAGEYVTSAMASLINPDATADCGFCQYTVADQYLSSINIEYGTRW